MEQRSSPERLHGMVIANASLLRSLVAVLPLEALQALLPELERDTEAGRTFLVGSAAPDELLDAHDKEAQKNLDFVSDQLQQKQAMRTPDGARKWIGEYLRPSGEDR
jgi:hypothetical protein